MKRILFPGILMTMSLAFTYVVVELAFPVWVSVLPVRVHWYLDEGIQVLAQYSKDHVIPEEYVAIFGDSYAAGKGDWYLESRREYQPPYSAAHVIHERTGRDVITYGASGAGSLRGLVGEPSAQFTFINASYRFSMEPPESVLVFFYEGNDLTDNLADLEARYLGSHPEEKLRDPAHFASFIEDVVHHGDPIYQRAVERRLSHNLYLASLLERYVRENFGLAPPKRKRPVREGDPNDARAHVNHARVDGASVEVPDQLPSPALPLSEEELDLTLYVFEQALRYLKKQLPDSKVGVVYIPSPIASYAITSPNVSARTTEQGREGVFPAAFSRERSDQIARSVEEIATANGASFADARPRVREASSKSFIHGPKDWNHFNEIGYTVLGEVAVGLLDRM
ncbi:MAG: GDSL-type esterase/lipase family protein [Myxococcota bacterium]|nr:GDSL-type esterase/lipase family protein [Myxococcota bacterium]